MDEQPKEKQLKAAFINEYPTNISVNPWYPDKVDKMEIMTKDDFKKLIAACRFFYKHDALVASVINKLIEMGITDLEISESKLSQNEIKLYEGLEDEFKTFAENMALEFLLSGLVVPEIKFANATKDVLREFGIKKFETLSLPVSMWVRDPTTIKINSTFIGDKPSYFVEVPADLIFFIMHEGRYKDGTSDPKKYQELLAYYPEFVAKVRAGEKYILIEDSSLIIRRRYTTESPYPIPYLTPVLEPLKHKRNLRRMDYSLAARAIGAIQLFRLGNDTFPVTEDQGEQFDALRSQMTWRSTGLGEVERIFQLFANHTLQIDWVYPPLEALLNDGKYAGVNYDIIAGLGFPKILISGEADRSAAADPQIAVISPVQMMEFFRGKILKVINSVASQIADENHLKGDAQYSFEPINLHNFRDFVAGITELYNSGNLSRESYAKIFGYDFEEEANKRSDEKKLIEDLGIDTFSPQPFSPQPGNTGNPQNPQPKPSEPKPKEPATKPPAK